MSACADGGRELQRVLLAQCVWTPRLRSAGPSGTMAFQHLDKILVSSEQVRAYESDGAVFLPGLFADWIEAIKAGIERNMREPGPYAAENLKPGEGGRFFDDYCNWQRIPEFVDVVHKSPAAEAAAALMKSNSAQ